MSFAVSTAGVALSDMIADRRLWMSVDRLRLVEDGAPEAAFLLAPVGSAIATHDVERLGLQVIDGHVVQITEEPEVKPAKQATRRKRSNGA